MKPKHFIISLVVYPGELLVSLGQTDAELLPALKTFIPEWADDYLTRPLRLGKCTQFEGNKIVLRLREYPKTADVQGCLAHEIFHAVYQTMELVGVKLCDNSEEAFAYLTGFLTREIYGKIRGA